MWYPVFLILALMVYFFLTLPVVKGYVGEAIVRFFLMFLDRNKYIVMNNLYLPAYNGLYMQIDHMVICRGLVILIETKNYNGSVEGDWRHKNWTIRNKYYSGKAYNPMRQNSYHIRMLEENNVFPDHVAIMAVVCLGLLARPETSGRMPVVTPLGLLGCIKRISGDSKGKWDKEFIAGRLKKSIVAGRGVGLKHRKLLKSVLARKKKGLCPRCGAKLYYRNSLKGKMAICTNYPWCKYKSSS